MSNETKIKELSLSLQPRASEFIKKGNSYLSLHPLYKDYTILIIEGWRSREYQAGLFSEGRYWDSTNRKWSVVNKALVKTWTMESKHCHTDENGKPAASAFDYALLKNGGKELKFPDPNTQQGKQFWVDMAHIALDLGLYPGALWAHRPPDYDHISGVPE